jgi:hypothetical protein
MSDRFEQDLRDQLHKEAELTSEFPRRLRGRIREAITPRRRSGLAPQLALAGALVVVAAIVLYARSPQTIINDVRTGVSTIFSTPSPSPTPQPFVCQDATGGSTGVSSQVTGVRVASHESDGYDRIVFDFSGGIPSYDVTRQASANFVQDASGQTVQLEGNAGLKLVLRDADVASAASTSLKPALASIREIRQVGNFERVVSYGIGLASAECMRVVTLSNPSRLVVDVATAVSASTTAAPTPLPTVPEATALPGFACQDQAGGTAGGPQMQLTAIRIAHQPAGYDRIVFEFAAPPGSTPQLPPYTLSRQASTHYVKDPSGVEVTLRGSRGFRLVLRGATASAYSGSRDQTPGLQVVQELAQIGDFEGVLSWGAGLSRDSCLRTVELTNPTRLVIDVQTP